MKQIRTQLIAITASAVMVACFAPAASAKKLSAQFIRFEINATAGDAGVHVFLDGVGWDTMQMTGPNGLQFSVLAEGSIGFQGITEFFFESAEPSFDVQSLDELLALFPEGIYRFEGTTTEGDTLVGEAELTHALPEAPEQVSPVDGDSVDPCDAVLEWELVDDPEGSEIVAYKVVAETDDDEVPLRVFDIDVTADTDSVTLPPEFLLPGAYKWEVLAIEASHNQTISETEFEVEDDNDCDEDSDDDSDSDSDSHASKRHKG